MKHSETGSNKDMTRRNFIKTGAAAGLGVAMTGCGESVTHTRTDGTQNETFQKAEQRALTTTPGQPKIAPIPIVKMGIVGVGMQGSSHVRNFLKIPEVEIVAVCDLVQEKVQRMQRWCEKDNRQKPKGYFSGETDFRKMCAENELDLVFTATPWKWHVPVCVEAMKTGAHAATEVPAAVTIDECWQLVETAERYQKHCVMMENCNYGHREMMILNMVRRGLLGELIHAECGYNHDLRNYKVGDLYQGRWRIQHSISRNGNLYPTHGLGPVAQCMNINRGNQFDFLTSMSSKSRGLNLYAAEHLGSDSPEAKQTYKLGDVNVSLIHLKNGETVTLYHDTNLPRPYTRISMVQGTHGIVKGYPDEIHIEGRSEPHRWEPLEHYKTEFEHQLWKTEGQRAEGAGHGGMDYLEDYRLIQSLVTGTHTDMDVYDAAALSCVSQLSEMSVANRSCSVDFPDFTRGQWKHWLPVVVPGV